MSYRPLLLFFLVAPVLAEDANPFFEAAKTLIQDSLAKNEGGISSIVQGLVTSGAGKHIGDLISGSRGIGDIISDPQVLQNLMSSLSPNERQTRESIADKSTLSFESVVGSLVPLLITQGHEHHDEPELEDVHAHEQFDQATSMFNPILAQVWEVFRNSEMGKGLWDESGLRETVDHFLDLRGRLKLEEALKSLENPQFRKRWLRSLVAFVARWVNHVSNPETHKRYRKSIALNINSFLKSIGYHDKDLFHNGRPFEESLIHVINTVAKGHLGLMINSGKYIRPAARYINELMLMGRSSTMSMSREIEDKLAETLNKELIEGVLRVWRAYKYALKVPSCDQYLLCELNRPHYKNGYLVRPGITKASSMVAAWFLSGHTGTPFWKLYNSAVEEYDCQKKYPVDCSGFHEEDIRVTTEYYHSEL
ncbi:uncharacterized protein [Halyomorpha halys]|uniref:uncharacterized protein n=1 Tax=Halyomorpha halys TaxID=286706 RepID=UPI0006D51D33|nr:uncharacterized protein LOC106689531 [Halyomorpha halys]